MTKTAILYRMVTEKHICPFGLKSKDLLKRKGFDVQDHLLTTREQADAFKAEQNVKTTPQTFIEGKRIGGYDDLVEHFGVKTLKQTGTTYQPVIALFAMTFLMAVAVSYSAHQAFVLEVILPQFIAISMVVLAIMKLRDLYSFTNQFITYDILGQRFVRYAYIYPFIEGISGVLMMAGILPWIASLSALFIASVNGYSVFKAVYVEKREIKCACVGGNSNVPLGFLSLTENIMMIAMALWMMSHATG